MSRAVLCVFAVVALCAVAQGGWARPPPPKPTLGQKVGHVKDVVGHKLQQAKHVVGHKIQQGKQFIGHKLQQAEHVIGATIHAVGGKVNQARQVVANVIAPKKAGKAHLH